LPAGYGPESEHRAMLLVDSGGLALLTVSLDGDHGVAIRH